MRHEKMSRRGRAARLLAAPVLLALAGAATDAPPFVDVTAQAGLDFVHYNAATEEKYMVETMGSGGGLFDYDDDGDLDIYLVNGAPLPGSAPTPAPPRNVLYRNDGEGRFTDVTDAAGVGDTGYGMGMTAADVDDDGDLDLYVTNFGPNVFYRNNGDGTFTDATAAAGLAAGGWSTSAAFGDMDGDGFVDLFVCRYVDFALDNHKFCGNLQKNIKAYCHPDVYNPVPSLLFRNRGDGTFEDVTREAGVFVEDEGKSLGVVWGDVDGDGDLDLYVANDSMRNFLFVNDGTGRFEDRTLLAGVGYSEDGEAQAGMGTDLGDVNGDGWLDVIVTNLDFEYNALYLGAPTGVFTDASYNAGVAEPSLSFVGFGTFFFDYDNDADLDLFVANGHIIDNIALFNTTSTYRQPNFLFENDGKGSFALVPAGPGDPLGQENVARGAAPGDVDLDGDEDVLVTRCGEAAALWRNEAGSAGRWIGLRLVGRRSSRDGVGARVELEADGRRIVREVRTGRSYLSQGALELLVGLGGAELARDVRVRWPSGAIDALGALEPGRRYVVVEGLGVLPSPR